VKFYHTIQGTDEILLVSNAPKQESKTACFRNFIL